MNVSIHGCNCCKTGIEVSKCVYLACMAVKIEYTVGHTCQCLRRIAGGDVGLPLDTT